MSKFCSLYHPKPTIKNMMSLYVYMSEQVRCMYCEYDGSRIVHPSRESFHGRDIEFEKMLCGEEVYSQSYTNNGIIAHSRGVDDDVMFD